MLTDPKLRSQVDALWDKFWTGGLSNPLDAIEQFSYLLFLKRLDDRENAAERQAKRKGTAYQPKAWAEQGRSLPKEMRWGYWTQMKAEEALSHLKSVVFPGLVNLAEDTSSFAEYMKGAQCKAFGKAELPALSEGSSSDLCVLRPEAEGLIEACNLIDQMKIAEQNQDVQGDASAGSAQVYMSICWVTCSLPPVGDLRRGAEHPHDIVPEAQRVGWCR